MDRCEVCVPPAYCVSQEGGLGGEVRWPARAWRGAFFCDTGGIAQQGHALGLRVEGSARWAVAQVQRMLLKSESISPAVGQFSRMVTAVPLMTLYVLLRVMPLIRRASLSRLC